MRRLFQLLLFMSGLSALIYQVVWQRVLTQAIGVDNIAIVFIVTIFMLGLGFGALTGGLFSRRPLAELALIYAAIEVAIGVCGLLSVGVLRAANAWFLKFGFNSIFADFALNCTLLFLPIFLMGMTTPIAIQIIKDKLETIGGSIGRFYGANVLGAAAGSLLTVPLIELIDLRGTLYVAVAFNLLIGIVFFLATRSQANSIVAAIPVEQPLASVTLDQTHGVANARIFGAALCFGFANLAAQIIVMRLYINYMTPVSYLFPVALAAYLLLMALGQSFGGFWIDRLAARDRSGFIALTVGGVVLAFVFLTNLSFVLLDALRPTFAMWRVEFILLYSLPIAFAFMLPAFAASALLPILSKMATRTVEQAGSAFGTVLFWSTIGNIIGAFFVGIVLFERIGAIASIYVACLVMLLGFALVHARPSGSRQNTDQHEIFDVTSVASWSSQIGTRPRMLLGYLAALAALLIVAAPKDYFRQSFSAERDFVAAFRTSQPIISLEGRSGVTSLYANRDLPYRFEVRPSNSGAAAVLTHDAAAYYRYYSLAPALALDTQFRPRRILQIGMGAGEFPFVAKELPFVEKFDMVELVPEVVEAYGTWAHPAIRETLKHPKVTFHVTDGRRFMQNALARGDKYDFIEIGVTGLSSSGISNMYSADLFKDIRKLLNPGGVVAVEPYIAHARLLFEFFPHAYQFDGSSWLFFLDKPPTHADKAAVDVDEFVMRALKATRLVDMRTPLPAGPCRTDSVGWVPVQRERIIPRFNSLLGTDSHLPFEYFYLSQYRKGFLFPAMLTNSVPGLLDTPRTLNVRFGCATGPG
jgi:spermidine synthase